MSLPHWLQVPKPCHKLKVLLWVLRHHHGRHNLWKLHGQCATHQMSLVTSEERGHSVDLLPLPEAPLRLLISFCQHLAEGLARGCVGGGAAVAAIQRGALVPAATSAVRVSVAAALRRVARLCSSTWPASEEVGKRDLLPLSLHRQVYLRCGSFRDAIFLAENLERLQLR